MKKRIVTSIISAAIAMTMMAMPAMAASPSNGSTLETPVKYTVAETEWKWAVPAAQTFTDSNLSLTGSVSITPVGDVIALADGTKMDVTLNSANSFALKQTDRSSIAYQVKKGGTVLSNGNNVLNFTAGTSANTGVSQELAFTTTTENIKAAKLTGLHNDTITFTVAVTTN